MRRWLFLLALPLFLGAKDCRPVPTPTPVPTPVPTPTPTPTPTPDNCVLAGEPSTPISGYKNIWGNVVNKAMHALRPDCEIGSRCVITERPQVWQAKVEARLRLEGLCAGQHLPGTDEIAVAQKATDPWEGFHIYTGAWDDPNGKGTVVWSPGADRGAWKPPDTPTPTPPPTPLPTPTPVPVPTPTPTPTGCGLPTPPPAFKFVVKVHNAFCANLDSTVLVQGAAYCAAVGFTDGRSVCPVRGEGAKDRAACEALVIGGIQTWSCSGGCEVYPCSVVGNCSCAGTVNTNPSQAIAMKKGTVSTCTVDGKVCGSLVMR